MPLEPGQLLSHYRLVEKIGEGGMGVVWKARDEKLRRDVALKVLPADLVEDPERRRRLLREARTAAAVNHPNIAMVHEVDEAEGTVFIAMELVEGKTLRSLLGGKPLAIPEALRIATETAEGLVAAHQANVIHRDLKPENILIRPDGHVKILDFGLAKVHEEARPSGSPLSQAETVTDRMTRHGVVMGTPAYMSPEQTRGEAVDARSDLFSFGCVLYEMLTGAKPFARATAVETLAAILGDDPIPLASAEGIPRGLQQIVLRALEKEPTDRYPTAANLRDELAALRDSLAKKEAGSRWGVVRTTRVLVPLVLLGVVLSVFGVRSFQDAAERRWARQEALPEVVRLVEADEYAAAFDLAREIERVVPDDPMLAGLWNELSNTVSVETDPPGAQVLYRPNAAATEWRSLGPSPIVDQRLPLGGFRLRVEKEGFEPREVLAALSYPEPESDNTFQSSPAFIALAERNRFVLELDEVGTVPAGMVAVDGGEYTVALRNTSFEPVTLEPFFIDRTEVSNVQFKEFVDAGGYERPEFWQDEFRREGRTLALDAAMTAFVDTTGRAGPAAWEMGDYPEGEGNYPVGGVSWYEAAAYAAFRGNSLPTVYHWMRAALPGNENVLPLVPEIVPLSNFGNEGVAPVGSFPGIGVSGASDLAGNLREWCWNATGDNRLILGGAWSMPAYKFTEADGYDPFDRSELNGFRTMRERGGDAADELRSPVDLNLIDFTVVEPLSDDAFAVYQRQFAYDNTPLNSQLESSDDSQTDWRRETVLIDAAYGGERFRVHLYLPKHGTPPFEAVVYVPGSNAFEQPQFADGYWENFDYIAKSGRVLVRPILTGSYERIDATLSFDDRIPRTVKDLGRTLDYLESRGDIQPDRIAYLGLSYGAWLSPINLAAENRFGAAVLLGGGVGFRTMIARFAPRVTTPVLMLGGRYDSTFPAETSQKRLRDLFGTPEQDKRLVLYDVGHLPLPRGESIREILAWLDRYQSE